MDANEDSEVKAVARRCPSRSQKLFCVFQSDAAAGTATFEQQSSVMTVFTEDGVALGSKAVSSPEIGSEFEFEEFWVTVEGARSAPFDDVTGECSQKACSTASPLKTTLKFRPSAKYRPSAAK